MSQQTALAEDNPLAEAGPLVMPAQRGLEPRQDVRRVAVFPSPMVQLRRNAALRTGLSSPVAEPAPARPTVSIITPTYNSEKTLPETLGSVLGQSFPDWEHIIVDDASCDQTRALLVAHCRVEPRARWIGLAQNQGPAVARNRAILEARGRYIAFLDSDDVWLPQKLERQLEFMQERDIAFSFTSFDKMDAAGRIIGAARVPHRQTYRDLLRNNKVGCLTAIYDTHKLGKVMMPDIRLRQDLGLWLRILKRETYGYGLPERLARYRVHKSSISAAKGRAARYTWRLYRDVERLPMLAAAGYFLCYALSGVAKTYLAPQWTRVARAWLRPPGAVRRPRASSADL